MELVIVERTYVQPVTEQDIARSLQRPKPCYDLRRVKHVASYVSRDGFRVLCLYEAPDAAAVREANDENGDRYDRIWTGTRVVRGDEPGPLG